MAVTVANLREALRLPTGQDEAILTRILGTAAAIVGDTAPNAPETVRDEATIRLASYLYDSPASGTVATANAFRNSGAELLLRRWVVRGAIIAG